METAIARTDTEVRGVRADVKEVIFQSQHTQDINTLLEQLDRLCQYNIYIQEEESKLNGLLVDAKQTINTAKESVKVNEAETALRLNSPSGGSIAMNKAEKLAFLESKPLREEVRMCEEAWIEVQKDYNDVKGFKNALGEYIMTIRQKIKAIQIESGVYPHRNEAVN